MGKAADSLEQSTENSDEYMITDNDPLTTKFISVPKEISQFNCGSFVAGIIEAFLENAGFVRVLMQICYFCNAFA